jgi:hypothetical protein
MMPPRGRSGSQVSITQAPKAFVRVQVPSGDWVSVNISGMYDGASIRRRILQAFNGPIDECLLYRKEVSPTGTVLSQPTDEEIEALCRRRDVNELQLQFMIRMRIGGGPQRTRTLRTDSLPDSVEGTRRLLLPEWCLTSDAL